MSEQWKPVVGFEGLYEVSDRGRVRSIDHIESVERFKFNKLDRHARSRIGHILAQGEKRRHMYVNLWKNGKMHTRQTHCLVLEAFVGSRPDKNECRHLDGNGLNNLVGNLAWGTHQENVLDAIKHGTWTHGERSGKAKLTETDVRTIRNATNTQRAIAKQFGVSQATIWQIKRGNHWKHV